MNGLKSGEQPPFAAFGPGDISDFSLNNFKLRLAFHHVFHIFAVSSAVNLCAQGVYGRAFSAVKHTALEGVFIGGLAHLSAERVNFADKVTLACSANRGVAGHIAHPVHIDCEHADRNAEPCGGKTCFNSGVTCAYNNDVIIFCIILHFDLRLQAHINFRLRLIILFEMRIASLKIFLLNGAFSSKIAPFWVKKLIKKLIF